MSRTSDSETRHDKKTTYIETRQKALGSLDGGPAADGAAFLECVFLWVALLYFVSEATV